MQFTDQQRTFLDQNHGAAMIALRPDGTPTAVRVGVALVDGKLWSSGTQGRRRTQSLRRDPRSTLFVFSSTMAYLTIEARVRILEGDSAPADNLRLFRVMQGRPRGPLSWFGGQLDEDAFVQAMHEEQRLIYEFEPLRVYGML